MAVIAQATHHGRPAAAGVTLALASFGSAAGVLIYGSRDWRPPVPRQFLIAIGMLAAGLLLLVSIESLVWFALANVIAGVPMAPVIAAQSLLVSRIAPREMLAESFTWSTTCLLFGISAGIAAGGVMAEYVRPAGALVWAVVRE
jgi:MFS family permease